MRQDTEIVVRKIVLRVCHRLEDHHTTARTKHSLKFAKQSHQIRDIAKHLRHQDAVNRLISNGYSDSIHDDRPRSLRGDIGPNVPASPMELSTKRAVAATEIQDEAFFPLRP